MVFIDHSNLRGHVESDALPLTADHYKALISQAMRGFEPSSHREGTPSKHAYVFIYAPDNPTSSVPRDLRELISDIRRGAIPGALHRGAKFHYEQADCRARLSPPKWDKACQHFRREPREKMLDVSLATDLVRFACKDDYDVAILVAGDCDYTPAVNVVKRAEQCSVINAFTRRTLLSSVCTEFMDVSALFRPGRRN